RIGHNPSASLHVRFSIFQNYRTQRDATIAIPVKTEPADRSGIKSTPCFLQLSNDLHRANLRSARNGARRKSGAKGIKGTQTITQSRLNMRDNVHDVTVTLDRHLLGHTHAADLCDAAKIVASEID